MKKTTVLFCILSILMIAAGALAAPGDAILFTEAQRREMGITNYGRPAIAGVGGTLYLMCEDGTYIWQAGQESPRRLSSDIKMERRYSSYADAQKQLGEKADHLVSILLSEGDILYGLNTLNGKFFPLGFPDGAVTNGAVQLDWEGMEQKDGNYTYIKEIVKAVIFDGKVYMLIRDYTQNEYYPAFVCFDLKSGAKQTFKTPFIQDFTPYQDGKLLVKIYDMEHAYDEVKRELKKPTLGVFDPAADAAADVKLFPDRDVSGLVYQAQTDTLYYMAPNKLMAMKALGEPIQAAYLPMDYGEDSTAVLLDGGLYAINSWNGVFVRNTDPEFMPAGSLSVYQGNTDQATMAFTAKYPDVPVTFSQDTYFDSAQAMAQAMVSGDSSFDIYRFSINYQDFTTLLDKGYCADLGASPVLAEQIGKMYPFLQQVVSRDGKFYALPVEMYSYGLSYSPKNWKDAGIGEERLPKTFLELIDFMNWWAQEGKDAHPDLMLLEGTSDYRTTMMAMAIGLYVQDCQARGEDLAFDTPLFRKLMAAVESLDTQELDVPLAEGESDEELYNGKSLFMNYYDWLYFQSDADDYSRPLPLPLDEGMPIHIPTYVQVMFINPNSKNFDMALRYLETTLEYMERSRHVMLFPDDNEPVPMPDFDKWITQVEDELAKAKKQLESAKPEEKKDLEATVKSYEDLLAKKDKYYWQVSAEGIASYRKLADMCYAATPNLLDYRPKEGESEIQALVARYQQKQIPLDQFIAEADKKIRMILLERQ